jgi:uncharacterized protein (TIGR03118 family)
MLKRVVPLVSALSLALLASTGSAAAGANAYSVTKLVSDVPGEAAQHDPGLVNAWGLVAGPSTPWWVADNGTNLSTLYDGTGAIVPLVVKVGGAPTGTVFNGGPSFVVSHHGESGPSLFLFSTEAGTIRGWNPNVPTPSPSTKAFTVVRASSRGPIYKGLAIASTHKGDFLYAADFHNAAVDVFDGEFNPIRRLRAFTDPGIPDGYAPFGIQTIGHAIFVSYAKQDPAAEDEIAGPGLGFVDMYSPRGRLLGRVASHGDLNAPWGLAWAPEKGFGAFGGDLLVGNFGDGRIHAYAPTASGSFEPAGALRTSSGRIIVIDGLWALQFGNGDAAGPANSLFFTAGPDDETHGLFGRIEAAA